MYFYLILDFAVLSVPFLFSFHPRIRFDREWKYYFPATAITAAVFIIWDIIFTADGVWGFNSDYITGIKIFNQPLEEILFFLFIPYSCVFTFHIIRKSMHKLHSGFCIYLTTFLSVFFFLISVGSVGRNYTFFTFLAGGIVLMLTLLFKPTVLKPFYVTYLIILIPFLLVNGLLTGTGIHSEVVWYNNVENLNIRVLTIPVEDFVYALTLILANIMLMEFFRSRKKKDQLAR